MLKEGLTLGGVVNDSHGMPLAGGELSDSLPGQVDALRSVSIEGSSGAFEMKGLPRGALELHVTLADGKNVTGTTELDTNLRILMLAGGELRIILY